MVVIRWFVFFADQILNDESSFIETTCNYINSEEEVPVIEPKAIKEHRCPQRRLF